MRHLLTIIPFLAFALAFGDSIGSASALKDPVVTSGVDGVLEAFKRWPIVGLADIHNVAQEHAFYLSLLRDPRFVDQVGNVVVEIGGAEHQEILDRYLAGETVPYEELRKVWTDTIGWIPAVNSSAQLNFFASVRAMNAHLPDDHKIHVWLGEPPVDWSKIHNSEDLAPAFSRRVSYPADLIVREILAKKKKALIIFGGLHFRGPPEFDLAQAIEARYAHSVFVVAPYVGFNEQACGSQLEAKASTWPHPAAFLTPIKGSWLEATLRRSGCTAMPALGAKAPSLPTAQRAKLSEEDATFSGAKADALLYLGSGRTLLMSTTDPTFYLDQSYFDEIARRFEINTAGQDLSWETVVNDSGQAPKTLNEAFGRDP